jgi:hypothetical protein
MLLAYQLISLVNILQSQPGGLLDGVFRLQIVGNDQLADGVDAYLDEQWMLARDNIVFDGVFDQHLKSHRDHKKGPRALRHVDIDLDAVRETLFYQE